ARTTIVKPQIVFLFLLGLLLAGCGGSGQATGDITGFIEDINGNPVRNARVYVDGGPQTFSNSAGSYRLAAVFGDVRTIKASVTQDGVGYYGENVVQVFNQETSKSTNITVVPSSQRATFSGTVEDRFGNLVQGAHVFAAAISGGNLTVFSSNIVLTDSNGAFQITDLMGGQDYSVIASATGFNSDTDTINIPAGQNQNLLFTLKNPTDPLLTPPANIEGIAWTTPFEASTRVANQKAGLEAIKQMIQPKRKSWKKLTRDTTTGNFVEIDLDWTPMSDPSLIGFEIYRGSGNVGTSSLVAVDFYRDPQAYLYEDLDPNFMENQTYTYAVTSLNTNAPNTANSESNFSSLVVVSTLADMNLEPMTFGPVTFHWDAVAGADTYEVFVFDRNPSVGISSIWNASTAGTSLAYGGPSLTTGNTYYYVVLGKGNGGSSKTLSLIGSFAAP
ncbi:MAG: carboxypeptidase regulatory-like domain-containing protein, partial [Fimbriimonadales bacterium]